jgi:hypothetical protein
MVVSRDTPRPRPSAANAQPGACGDRPLRASSSALRVAQLVRREAAPRAGPGGDPPEPGGWRLRGASRHRLRAPPRGRRSTGPRPRASGCRPSRQRAKRGGGAGPLTVFGRPERCESTPTFAAPGQVLPSESGEEGGPPSTGRECSSRSRRTRGLSRAKPAIWRSSESTQTPSPASRLSRSRLGGGGGAGLGRAAGPRRDDRLPSLSPDGASRWPPQRSAHAAPWRRTSAADCRAIPR